MTRALIVNSIPSPYNDALFRQLAEQEGLTLHVAYCANREANRSWTLRRDKGYSYEVMPGVTVRDPIHLNPGVVGVIRRFLPDVAVLTGSYTMPTMQMAAGYLRWRGIPWGYWGEELDLRPLSGMKKLARALLRRTIVSADAVLAIGTRACDSYIRAGVSAQRVVDFRYYADTDHFDLPSSTRDAARRSLRAEFGYADADVVFLYCGQLVLRKGVDVLIDAAAILVQTHPHTRIVIAGDGPNAAAFERRARDRKIAEFVRFVGFVQPEQLPHHFAMADGFVLPSRHEGWGVVVHEALAAGLPVITSDRVNAGIDLVRDDENGWTFAVGSAPALASAMERLHDARDRAALSRAARAVALRESPRTAATRLACLLGNMARREPLSAA